MPRLAFTRVERDPLSSPLVLFPTRFTVVLAIFGPRIVPRMIDAVEERNGVARFRRIINSDECSRQRSDATRSRSSVFDTKTFTYPHARGSLELSHPEFLNGRETARRQSPTAEFYWLFSRLIC